MKRKLKNEEKKIACLNGIRCEQVNLDMNPGQFVKYLATLLKKCFFLQTTIFGYL